LLVVCTFSPGQEVPAVPQPGTRLDVARILVAAKADVNARNREGGTALMGAAGSRGTDLELLKLLLRSGAKVNLRDRLDQTALMFASGAYGHPEAARLLLAAGADIRAEDWEGHTALWRATSSRRPEIVQILRRGGARE
jgi:ankyrin repeat protein